MKSTHPNFSKRDRNMHKNPIISWKIRISQRRWIRAKRKNRFYKNREKFSPLILTIDILVVHLPLKITRNILKA
jgi:hypothetical protein